MKKSNLKKIDSFDTILRLKELLRQGWIGKVPIADIESVADHSYSLSMLTLLLTPIENKLRAQDNKQLNKTLLLEKAILHDIGEANYFDIDKTFSNLLGKEKSSEIKSFLDKQSESKFQQDYLELTRSIFGLEESDSFHLKFLNLTTNSEEDLFIKLLDVLELYLQTKRYVSSGFITLENSLPFLKSASKKIKKFDKQFRIVPLLIENGIVCDEN